MRGALGASVELALRSMALPWFLGLRWIGQAGDRLDGVPSPKNTLRLAAKMAADEIFLSSELLVGSVIAPREGPRIAKEMGAALELYDRRGWLSSPERYHLPPPPMHRHEIIPRRSWGVDYEHLQYTSGWEPHRSEPGRTRWLGYKQNRTAHARLLRHRDEPRPWIICTPGYRMGSTMIDFFGFRAFWLHEELGLNVAIPVLPFHGPRTVGRRGGDGFLTGDLLDTIHAQAQAVWDVRRLIGWLREKQRAPAVGVYGLSLGGYTAGLLAGLQEDLDCVIAGIPASCWVELVRSHTPAALLRVSEKLGFPWDKVEDLFRVVSPLAMRPLVPRSRRFVFAGTSDRLAPPRQAQNLWEHWEKPRLTWYEGGHVSFLLENDVRDMVADALDDTGMLDLEPPRARRRPTAPLTGAQMAGRPANI